MHVYFTGSNWTSSTDSMHHPHLETAGLIFGHPTWQLQSVVPYGVHGLKKKLAMDAIDQRIAKWFSVQKFLKWIIILAMDSLSCLFQAFLSNAAASCWYPKKSHPAGWISHGKPGGSSHDSQEVCSECREPLQLYVPHKEVPLAMAHAKENLRDRNRSRTCRILIHFCCLQPDFLEGLRCVFF